MRTSTREAAAGKANRPQKTQGPKSGGLLVDEAARSITARHLPGFIRVEKKAGK